MSYLVEMMDGTVVDLDYVIAISDIDAIGISYSGRFSTITNIVFYLALTGPSVIVSFNKEHSNRLCITLEKVNYSVDTFATKEKHIEMYKLSKEYQRYLDFIELFKNHKKCNTIIKV